MSTKFIFFTLLALFCQSLFAQSSQNNLTVYLFNFPEGESYQLRFVDVEKQLFLTKQANKDELILPNFEVREFWVKVYADGEQISTQFFQLQDDQQSILINPSVALSEVVIETEEKAIEVKSDRLVYHMQSSAFRQGFNSAEVLEKVPFVRVTGEGISIIGKGTVLITINDKKVHFSGTQLLAYLNSIPSERIKKIEVITNPPAKYDSYGNGGVINIQLKPTKHEGYALLLSSAYTQHKYANFRGNANFNYHKGKWNLNLNLNYARKKRNMEHSSRFVNAGQLLRETNKSEIEATHQFLAKVRTEYQWNAMTTLGLDYTYIQSQAESQTNQQTFFPKKAINLLYGDTKTRKNVINLYADIKLDTLGTQLSLLGTYIHNNAEKQHEATSFQFANEKQQKNEIYEFKGLMEIPLNESLKIDFGVDLTKATDLIFNQLEFKDSQHKFDYSEFTYDLFFDFYWDYSEAFTLSGGLKYEGWDRQIDGIDLHEYFVFPTLNLAYEPDENNNLTLSYSKRMVKPYLNYLDPYKVYTAPDVYSVGNPYLVPFTIDNLELRYAYKGKLFLTAYSVFYDELFGTVTKLEGGNQVITKENTSDSQQYGAMISYFYRSIDWWDIQLMYHTFYQIPRDVSEQFKSFSGLSTSFYVNNDFYLTPDKSTVLGFSYFHSFPTKAVKTKASSVSTFNLSFKTPIVKDLLQLKLSAVDLFNQRYRKGRIFFSNGNIQYFNQNRDVRQFNITMTLSLGKKKSVKTIDNKNRIE